MPASEKLEGRWVHSHEEDTDHEMVFRPATHSFPPSRGRTSFELRGDGTYVERSPGPVDVPEESSGSWSLDADRLVIGDRDWRVAAIDDDRLVVKKSAG